MAAVPKRSPPVDPNAIAADATRQRVLAACTGSLAGVLLDIVQQGSCAAVKLSLIFVNAIRFAVEPIYFVILLVFLGFAAAWALEKRSSTKLFMYAAGLTTFLQTSVPGTLPVTGSFEKVATSQHGEKNWGNHRRAVPACCW